ncbi:hypothetical protein ebA5938 [Aromatoleum aromaticum EbN1]|uniref:Uncharacterized protein n=1 Tax=Aromatoleum aromaticum (strain DSM 19018 / LMG 30748 / EbN1) TaxID=76114 RepID=Q5NZL0_AROAE|nr:hypothetical protein [Aromatoleum aromaticum]CAI09504.1 hypothetical protein ebA5938 [Aromatoleum aromaticum EbN1]
MELTRSGSAGAPKGFMAVIFRGAEGEGAGVVTQASGGILMRFFSDTSGGGDRMRVLPSLPQPEQTRDHARTGAGVAADLDLIARAFGLNVAQIAEVCGGVTRPTVYAWRDGSAPRPAKLTRIHKLRRAALDWERSGFGVPGTAMTAPIIHEKNLFDLLRADPLDLAAIQFAGGRLAMERELATKRTFADPFR